MYCMYIPKYLQTVQAGPRPAIHASHGGMSWHVVWRGEARRGEAKHLLCAREAGMQAGGKDYLGRYLR